MRLRHLTDQVTQVCVGEPRPLVALENLGSGTGSLLSDAELPIREADPAGMVSFAAGDVLFGKLRPYLAKSLRAEMDGHCASELIVMRPASGVDGRWLAYIAQSRAFVAWAVATSEGVKMPRTSWEKLRLLEVDAPSLAEQHAIAGYLDAETARIDATIAVRRQQLELMKEAARSTLVTRVLRGLDPVTGRGNTPAGWDHPLLGVLIELHRGVDLPADLRVDGPVPVVSSGGVSGWNAVAAAKGPGVVTGRYGTIGEVFYVDADYWPLNTTLYVSDFRGNNPRWVYHLLRCMPLDFDAEKSAVTGINRNVVGELRAVRPPLEEQTRLAADLDVLEAKTAAVSDALRRQIALLLERRQALITAAVTGQVDIPGVSA